MSKEILLVLTPDFADWEAAFTAAALNAPVMDIPPSYLVKTVGLTGEPVRSIGGLTVLPDYSLATAPEDCAALLLIGGMSWCTPDRRRTGIVAPLIPVTQRAVEREILVGGICDASTFLGAGGWLNAVKHTSNTLADLKHVAGDKYTNAANYLEEQAVRDGNIVTANGTAYLEFTREVLMALDAYPAEALEAFYDFYKYGYYEALKKHKAAPGI